MLATVRSRCQTFVFQRPRLPDLVTLLRRVAEGEGIQAQDSALSLIARSARGSFRDAVSTLDQLASATNNSIDAQSVLQLVGAVDEESLLRLCDIVVDRDTAGALLFLEQLAEQGQDLGRVVTDLLEHLRHLLLVQHMGHVPESLPVTEETKERLREQANQLPGADGAATHRPPRRRRRRHPPGRRPAASARARAREGDAARVRSLARVARAPRRAARGARAQRRAARRELSHAAPSRRRWSLELVEPPPADAPAAPPVELEQVTEAWDRSILDAVRERSIPVASLLTEATPTALADDTLTLEFPAGADFHRRQVAEPQNIGLLRDALYEVTGRKLAVVLESRRGRGARGAGGRRAALRRGRVRAAQGDLRRPRGGGDRRMNFDMNKMLQEAQRMQDELAKAQEEAASEIVEASAGGGMVTVKANGAGEVVSITIDPRAIDPDDPELLADLVLAAVNEALRSARGLMESKMSGLMPGGMGDLGGLLPG